VLHGSSLLLHARERMLINQEITLDGKKLIRHTTSHHLVDRWLLIMEVAQTISWLLGRRRGELLGFGLELPLGPLWRVLGVGEPGGVEELLVRAVVVADEPELLALPHPPQHDLHLPLARQSHKANILDMAPDVGDGERSVLPDDIEDCARDGLRLLRRRCQLDRRHLWLPLLRRPPRCRREHSRLA